MQQQTNTGWYVLGGIALLLLIGYSMDQQGVTDTSPLPPVDDNAAPDTADDTEIIITPGK